LEDEVLPLGVASHALAVAPELRVVDREQLEPGHRPLPELVDRVLITEDPVDLPMRRDRPGVHDLHVTAWRYLFFELFGLHRHARDSNRVFVRPFRTGRTRYRTSSSIAGGELPAALSCSSDGRRA